jgi:hypothetical protein
LHEARRYWGRVDVAESFCVRDIFEEKDVRDDGAGLRENEGAGPKATRNAGPLQRSEEPIGFAFGAKCKFCMLIVLLLPSN